MRFWDSSALVPLLVTERTSPAAMREFEQDPHMVVWWGTEIECVSALSRLEREDSIGASAMTGALERLSALAAAWQSIEPLEQVRQTAIRLLRVHALRAGDALQLAAALAAAENQPSSLPMVTLDDRLALAAEREGFRVVLPTSN